MAEDTVVVGVFAQSVGESHVCDPVAQVVHVLLLNPWCSFRDLLAITGQKEWQLRQTLADQALIDRLAFPVHRRFSRNGKRVTLYNLTSSGTQREAGRFQNVGMLTTSLTLSYYRLTRARQIAAQMKKWCFLSWIVSPWWPGRLDSPIDALVGVRNYLSGGIIPFALLVAPQSANVGWYIDNLRKWRQAKDRRPHLDAVQLMFITDASEHVIDKERLQVLMAGETEKAWLLVDGTELEGKVQQRIEAVAASKKEALHHIPEHFLHRMPRYPVKELRQFHIWLEKDHRTRTHILRKCVRLTAPEIEMLWIIARFPAVDVREMIDAGMIEIGKRNLRRQLRNLLEGGLIVKISELPNAYTVSEAGLQVLAALHGVGADFMNRHLGNPRRGGVFVHQREHNRSVQQFMFSICRSGVLLNWQYMTPRYEFANIRIPGKNRIEKRTIYPDSTGMIEAESGEGVRFWLEVDRATRRGKKRIKKQIEKYFVIHYARQSEFDIPPLLYIVATDQTRETARLRQVIKCFKEVAASQFPNNQLVVLFSIEKALVHHKSEVVDAPLWILYHLGKTQGSPVSLRDGLLQARYIQLTKNHAGSRSV